MTYLAGHSTYDAVISLSLDCFCHLFHTSFSSVTVTHWLVLKLKQFTGHSDWKLVVTLIGDEISFFVALSWTLLGSQLDGQTAVLLLELIKQQPVTILADCSLAGVLSSYISLSDCPSPSVSGCGQGKESETDRGGCDLP